MTSSCSCMVLISFQHTKTYKELLPYVTSRSTQLAQEFAFFPTAPPHAQGGVFELRSYQLKPGTLLEWENTWCAFYSWPHITSRLIGATRRRGIEARRKFVAPIGAWFSQIGRLHQVHHMWQYPLVQSNLGWEVVLTTVLEALKQGKKRGRRLGRLTDGQRRSPR